MICEECEEYLAGTMYWQSGDVSVFNYCKKYKKRCEDVETCKKKNSKK